MIGSVEYTAIKNWLTIRRGSITKVLALSSAVLIVVLAFVAQVRLADVQEVAYPAIFLVSLVGNATIVLPAPAIISVCVGGTSLNPLLVGLVSGTGQAMGEITGYLAGFSGSGLARHTKVYLRIQHWMLRRGWIVLFVLALIPNPFFDLAGIAAGAVRLPIWKFLIVTWAGKTVRSVIIAYLCWLGYSFFLID